MQQETGYRILTEQWIEVEDFSNPGVYLEAEARAAIAVQAAMSLPGHLTTRRYVIGSAPNRGLLGTLTPREVDILSRLVEGKSSKEIARDLGTEASTVRCQARRLYQKIKVKNRVQAAIWMFQQQVRHYPTQGESI